MDRDVRDLERRWRASGDPADEAAWLVARVRAGQLEAGRVELAAALGHEAAALAATTIEPAAPPSRGAKRRREQGLPAWADEVPRHGYAAALRAAIALLELLRPEVEAALRTSPSPPADAHVELGTLFDRGLAALAAYALAPGPATREAVVALDEEESRASGALLDEDDYVARGPYGALEALHTTLAPIADDDEPPTRARGWFLAVLRDVACRVDAAALDDAVRAAVVPWALGLGEPLRPQRPA